MSGDETRWIESDFAAAAAATGGGGDDHADDDDIVNVADLFADPDPYDSFALTYTIPNNAPPQVVTITLVGHKRELGQTLHSTGLTLWRASELLAGHVAQHDHVVRQHTVLELGAGLGLCGLVAQAAGAARVVLTDGDSDVLANLRRNVVVNNSVKNGDDNIITCAQLIWGTEPAAAFAARFGQFDVILGADIIYIPDILAPLWQTVQALLASRGVFVLAYARRNVKFDHVLEHAERAGFVVAQSELAEGAVEGVYYFVRRDENCTEGT